jgi:hypothetical protein
VDQHYRRAYSCHLDSYSGKTGQLTDISTIVGKYNSITGNQPVVKVYRMYIDLQELISEVYAAHNHTNIHVKNW